MDDRRTWMSAGAPEVPPEALEEALLLLSKNGPEALLGGPLRFQGLVALEAFLEHSWAVLHTNPVQAVESARWATLLGSRLSRSRREDRKDSDLRCRAWAVLGNAYRVADNLAAAESSFIEAFNHYVAGSRDELLLARLIDFQASLWADQRHLSAAIESLNVVSAIFRAHGDEHMEGRALISKGLFMGYSNDAEGAVQLIQEGLAKIDSLRDPKLALWATHNLSLFMIDTGRHREARALARTNQWRFEQKDHRIDLLKLRWVEARANAGLGLLERAERGFLEVREGMLDVGKRYHSALAALDLSLIYLRQNRLDETGATVLAAADVFLDLEISREAIGAVLVLQNAYRKGLEAGALLERAVDFLRRLERDPALTFKSWFL